MTKKKPEDCAIKDGMQEIFRLCRRLTPISLHHRFSGIYAQLLYVH